MSALNQDVEKYAGFDAQVVGISVDSIYSHMSWQQEVTGNLKFPLCSDFWPHGEVAREYDIFRTGDPIPGINERAIYVVDKRGKIAFAHVYELGQQPDTQEVFDTLAELQQ